MRKIAIAGAGGFSKEVYITINDINKVAQTWDFIGFFDDNVPRGKFFMDFKVLGTIDELNNINEEIHVVIAAGKSNNILSIFKKLSSGKIIYPNLIHPGSLPHHESVEIGVGNIFQPYTSLSADNKIGNYNVFNAGVRIGHDTIIGNYNTFATSSLISGGVEIGDQNNFGMSSGILQYKKVGNANVIAPMSILFRSVKDNGHYIGVPAMPTGI